MSQGCVVWDQFPFSPEALPPLRLGEEHELPMGRVLLLRHVHQHKKGGHVLRECVYNKGNVRKWRAVGHVGGVVTAESVTPYRQVYVPTATDRALMGRCFPSLDPELPDWQQVRHELVEAGYRPGELAMLTISDVMAVLSMWAKPVRERFIEFVKENGFAGVRATARAIHCDHAAVSRLLTNDKEIAALAKRFTVSKNSTKRERTMPPDRLEELIEDQRRDARCDHIEIV